MSARTTRRRALTATAGFSLASAFLIACGGDDDEPAASGGGSGSPAAGGSPASSPTEAPPQGNQVRGGVFGTITANGENLDIFTTPTEYAQLSGQYVYDHLISTRSNENAPWVAEAAEGVEMSADGLTLTFKLRGGMKYQPIEPVNGRDVVAEDVVMVQDYVKNVAGAENSFQTQVLERAEAPDDRTVIYRLQRPTAYLFTSRMLGHPGPQAIVPHETFDNLATAQQVGSGPFMLDQWTIGTRYDYVRFDGYHGHGKPNTEPWRDGHVALFLVDEAAREAAFRSGQIHNYTPAAGAFDNVASSMGDDAQVIERAGLGPFCFNLGNAPGDGKPWVDYKDTRFRQALYRLTDRQQFIDLVYGGRAELGTSILATGQLDIYQVPDAETAEYYRYDVAEAKKLLAAMNWQQERDIRFDIFGFGVAPQAAEIMQQQWTMGGITTRIEVQNPTDLLARSQRGDYDVYVGGQAAYDSPQAPLSQNRSDTTIAWGGTSLNDPEIDALINKAEQTPDIDENAALVREIVVELAKRYAPYYHICTPQFRTLISGKVENYEVELSNTAMHRADMWFRDA
jgi:peptide/nickel transport system substrate-binding protein